MPPKPMIEFASLPQEVVLDLDGIRQYNRQRFDWEQLTAVTRLDFESRVVVAFKDYQLDESWVKGHFPERPLLPGVLMLEAAAQACSLYTTYFKLIRENELLAFGAADEVRFRGEVRPGQRMWIIGQASRNSVSRIEDDLSRMGGR